MQLGSATFSLFRRLRRSRFYGAIVFSLVFRVRMFRVVSLVWFPAMCLYRRFCCAEITVLIEFPRGIANIAPPVRCVWKAATVYSSARASGPSGRQTPYSILIWWGRTVTPPANRVPHRGSRPASRLYPSPIQSNSPIVLLYDTLGR